MATRRMVSSVVVGSDKFLNMPLSSQMLYVHYILEADNAGFFASAIGTMRRVGATQDDLDELLRNGYILRFESGVCCVVHWGMQQTLKNDRKNSSFPEAKLVRFDGGMYVMKSEGEIRRERYSSWDDDEE